MTALHPLLNFNKIYGTNIYIKRDDLFPSIGGGNKARKVEIIFEDVINQGSKSVITTGGSQSNHARAVAIKAAQLNLKCSLVLHRENQSTTGGNNLLMELAGADIKYCTPDKIKAEMDTEYNKLQNENLKPYYIQGGGHGYYGTLAYYLAADELFKQCLDLKIIPDYIIHASGTGTTQAGLLSYIWKNKLPAKVIGISVAREKMRGAGIIKDSVSEFCENEKTLINKPLDIQFYDQWVGEGYAIVNNKIINTIQDIAALEGIILDPTYTGKAFYALRELIQTNKISKDSTIVFLHTGGLLNLLTSKKINK